MGNAAHERGYAGEQSMGFYFGDRCYFLVDGPSGAGGHGITSSGFDGVAFHPTNRNLVIYDNKAFRRDGNVSSAGAITRNLAKNLDRLITRVESMRPDYLPHRDDILKLAQDARRSLEKHGPRWPNRVQLAVSNAAGQSTGVSKKLSEQGIRFVDYYEQPKIRPKSLPNSRGRNWVTVPMRTSRNGSANGMSKPTAAGAAAQLAIYAVAWGMATLNRFGLQARFQQELQRKRELISGYLSRDLGVLLIIRTFATTQKVGITSVLTHPGSSLEIAWKGWHSERHWEHGDPEGAVTAQSYVWLPPGFSTPLEDLDFEKVERVNPDSIGP